MWESESVLPVSQPDMTLSDQEIFGDDHPHDHCGVFGVWAPGEDVSRLTYFSLYALQHRGQQSAGIATSNGKQILVYKDQGLVSQVFSEQSLQGLRGHIALGHVRYATTGAERVAQRTADAGAPPPRARSPWPTTATSPTRSSCASWPPRSPTRARILNVVLPPTPPS